MKYFDWDDEKNKWLMLKRGISFEQCVECIVSERLVATVQNHPPYAHQKVYIIWFEGYCYEVPFVEDDEKIFLKTAHPSHKATKKYLNNNYE
jgi:hypothetical protein